MWPLEKGSLSLRGAQDGLLPSSLQPLAPPLHAPFPLLLQAWE